MRCGASTQPTILKGRFLMARKGKKRVLQSHFDWHHVCITVVALAGLAIPPLANAQPVYLPANDATKTFDPAAGSAEERSVKATKKAVNRLTERMAAFEFTDNADYNFAMVARMQRQADIDIAKIELEHGKEPMLRSMAAGIIRSQEKEIKQLDRWLALFEKFD